MERVNHRENPNWQVLSSRSYSKTAMDSILKKAWNLQEGVDITEITENAFMFRFSDEGEYNRILRGRPWSINGCLLNLLEMSKYKSCEELDFGRCPVWIQMHNVPMEAMHLENSISIGSHVGEVLLAEEPYLNGRYMHYARQKKEETYAHKKKENKKLLEEKSNLVEEDIFSIKISNPLVAKKQLKPMRTVDRKKVEHTAAESGEGGGPGNDSTRHGVHMPRPIVSNERQGIERQNGSIDPIIKTTTAEPMVLKDHAVTEDSSNGNNVLGDQEENSQAMILYSGGVLSEVIEGINCLGLKRSAEEVWDSSVAKRCKLEVVASNVKPAISVFTEKLRKNKARVKRFAKRKCKAGKENLVEDDLCLDEAMEAAVEDSPMDSGFVFKAGRGKRHKETAEGSRPPCLDFGFFVIARKDGEEIYWWQRSVVAWLVDGDRNTRFFHASVIQRRQRNKILRLKRDNGTWVEDRVDINRAFSSFYVHLFVSGGTRPMEEALSYIKEVVSLPTMNAL
ncbi:hypothetical protein K1719_007928 [Acacia pycnantha]|nr:hypothetical protein K1719_007928 [Acacia pycnantha]